MIVRLKEFLKSVLLLVFLYFNSMIVRLKEAFDVRHDAAEPLFQFYDSPIKSFTASKRESTASFNFNSMIVRLKETFSLFFEVLLFKFQFYDSAIKRSVHSKKKRQSSSFNSTIVRLKGLRR